MTVGILTIAYNEERFIEGCIRQFAGIPIERHLVLISEKPWHGDTLIPDHTAEIAEANGAEVVSSVWKSEDVQRNFGMELLSDCDWILVVDADERYSNFAIKQWLLFLSKAEYPAYGIGRLKTYWKDPEHVIEPEENGGLIVAVRPGVRFTDKRCINSAWTFLPKEIIMHHFSYVRSDEDMWKKITSFEHQHEIVPNWYEEVWKAWTPEMERIHPVNPDSFKKAVEIGDELKGYDWMV